MDKLLMNCFFYWYYFEKIGGVLNLMCFIFIINLENEENDGEFIYYGLLCLY